jgi:hypothetical protein
MKQIEVVFCGAMYNITHGGINKDLIEYAESPMN